MIWFAYLREEGAVGGHRGPAGLDSGCFGWILDNLVGFWMSWFAYLREEGAVGRHRGPTGLDELR
eukprot:5643891-Pyramimonas_sp.AAC.1